MWGVCEPLFVFDFQVIVSGIQDFGRIAKVRKQNVGKPFVKCSTKSTNQTSQKTVRVGVLGASGYTGSEVNCLARTPLTLSLQSFLFQL